jgi:hypothetical protein
MAVGVAIAELDMLVFFILVLVVAVVFAEATRLRASAPRSKIGICSMTIVKNEIS